jgi:hypothetical protein
MATTPKATLQGTLGPKLQKSFAAVAKTLDVGYAGPAVFVAPASAVAILYCATIGTLLTHTVGLGIARHFQAQVERGDGGTAGKLLSSGAAETASLEATFNPIAIALARASLRSDSPV